MPLVPVEKIKIHMFLDREIHIRFEGVEINITRFTRMDEEDSWEIPPHAHMNYELHYIYEGSGKVGLGKNVFNISQGEFYICPPFIDHSQYADKDHPMKEYGIECSIHIQEGEGSEAEEQTGEENENTPLFQMLGRILYGKHKDTSGVLKRNFTWIEELFEKRGTPGEELVIKSLLLNTILTMLVFSKKDPGANDSNQYRNDINYQRASSIRNYLEANYKRNITVKNCAQIFYLSERQIDRILTKVFDETFHGMLTKTRINIAINLIRTTDYPLDIVATEAGFSGYRQMLRSFKRFGIEQPTRLRKDDKWNETKIVEKRG